MSDDSDLGITQVQPSDDSDLGIKPVSGAISGQDLGDWGRIKNSFADPTTRANLQKMAFTQHPINWLESHAGDALPLAGMVGGGIAGTAGGAALGSAAGPVGTVGAGYATGIAGAGAGAAGGEALRAGIGRLLGVNKNEDIPAEALKEAKTGAMGEAIGAPVGGALGYMGKSLYNSAIRPAIEAGERAGTPGIEDVIYKYGVKTPTNLTTKTAKIANQVQDNVVTPILQKAKDAGADVSPDSFLAPLKELRNKWANVRSPEAESALKTIDDKIAYYEGQVKGTPELPGRSYDPVETTAAKRLLGYDSPVLAKTPAQQQIENNLYEGLMTGTEDSVGKTLGEGSKEALHEGNQEISKILASGLGQKTASNQASRALENLGSLRGTDAFGSIMGHAAGSGLPGFVPGFLAKKGFNAAQIAQMPVGYALKKFTGSLPAKQMAIGAATSPWLHLDQNSKQPVPGTGR